MKRSNDFVGFRLPRDLKLELEKEASQLGISLSTYIKLILDGQIKRGEFK